MPTFPCRNLGLKARLAWAMAVIFIGFVSLLVYAGLRYFEHEFRQSLYQHQYQLVSTMAQNLDDKLHAAQAALIADAAIMPREALADAERAQRFLDDRPALQTLFDNGLFLISADDRIVAESPFQSAQRRGRDISFREFIQVTRATRKPYISKPFESTFSPGQPAVIMTVPLLGDDGQIIGILLGGLKLLGQNMLADLSQTKIGMTGYVFVSTQDRLIIMHGDPSRVMKRPAAPGQNPLYDRALAGFEGSDRTVTSSGVEMYSSYKRLVSTGWLFAANYPVAEAEEPLRQARRYAIAALLAGAAAILLMVWLIVRHFMEPLGLLTRHVRQLPSKQGTQRQLALKAGGEIGTLVDAFNTMVAELDRQQATLLESEARFRSLTELSSDWYWEQDEQFRFSLISNSRNADFIQTRNRDAIGKTRWELPFVGMSEAQWAEHRRMLERHEPFHNFTYQLPADAGESRTISISGIPIFDPYGRFKGYRGVASDVTERQAAARQIEFMAYHDALTGLPNRLLMQDRMEQAVAQAQRNGHKTALLFLDLDGFKSINDTLGHDVGDALLKEVAARLRACIRDTDTISRQGGDEFLICLRDLPDTDTAAGIIEKLLEQVQQPMRAGAHEVSTTVSVGAAICPDDGKDFESLSRKADMAMYRAKEAGRNTYRFFDATMDAEVADHLMLRNGLRRALDHGELSLEYQPQIDLGRRAVIGAEALLRWKHPVLGALPPDRFIPVAEESGLIVPMGEWVLREACRQAMAWRQEGLPELVVAVNLSGVQFKRGDVEQAVRQALEFAGLPPQLLELEVTESILIQDADNVLATVTRLKQLGVKFSIDDFGTGYSSLSYLKRFDIDKLKIDRGFVRDLAADADDAAIVRAVIQMAHSLGLRTIAEGVESEDILQRLVALECDEAQGYYFAKPMPAEALARFLRQLR